MHFYYLHDIVKVKIEKLRQYGFFIIKTFVCPFCPAILKIINGKDDDVVLQYWIFLHNENMGEIHMHLKPLAYRMRPRTIDEVIGQKHLVGEGKIIYRMVKAKQLSSMILYGPPGIGKTSIASAIAACNAVSPSSQSIGCTRKWRKSQPSRPAGSMPGCGQTSFNSSPLR